MCQYLASLIFDMSINVINALFLLDIHIKLFQNTFYINLTFYVVKEKCKNLNKL